MKVPTTVCRAEKRRRNDEKCGLTTSPDTAVPPRHLPGPSSEDGHRRGLAKTIAGRTPTGHSYSATFHQVEFHCMPLKSDTVEAASRTLLLLEELNRHRVTSIDRLHKATGLPKSTVVRLMKSLW